MAFDARVARRLPWHRRRRYRRRKPRTLSNTTPHD
jgi:hypothetical protein